MGRDKKRGRIIIRGFIIGILMLVAAVSLIGFLREQMEAGRQRISEESLSKLASGTSGEDMRETATERASREGTKAEPETPASSPIDFAALAAQNPDTVGWIRIPGTRIDYPIVQASDNETYLHTGFDGNDSVYGTIYLDFESKADFSGWNNPLYGHHMKDGSMFKDVVKFKDEAFFRDHQFFEIYTPGRTIHLKAVSCYYSDSNGIVRKTKFNSQESFDGWVEERLAPCGFAKMPDVPVDSMFVLVTCSYEEEDARTLLFAVEVDGEGGTVPATGRNVPKPVYVPAGTSSAP